MKKCSKRICGLLFVLLAGCGIPAMAQPDIQYYRPNDKRGLNVFETTKADTTGFTKLKVKVGGNFTQDFQSINHQNNAQPVLVNGVNVNQLASLTSGFNLAMANLNIDAQLADGIRMNMTLYLSARHHEETWVKGGYIQFDKLPFLKSALTDRIMKNITIKVGDYEVDYGDQHFRRTDGGNAIHNPFAENYIMDEFATEIGGEVYYHSGGGLMAMVGVTNGALNPTVVKSAKIDSATGKLNKYSPAIHAKLGYDRQFSKDLRLRLTGSVYVVKSAANNTLFGGDRTGSHYFFAMENALATTDGNAFSGRYNPRFNQRVAAFMINPFVKYKGLEVFGTYEIVRGRLTTERNMRGATQYAADVIYRFTAKNENFWIGGRYNSVTAAMPGVAADITIDRIAGSVGWFVTKNIMIKTEYVHQRYNNFALTDIRSGGKFSGLMMEAVVGF